MWKKTILSFSQNILKSNNYGGGGGSLTIRLFSSSLSSQDSDVVILDKKPISVEPVPTRGPLPIITERELEFKPPHRISRKAWVDNLDTVEEVKLGMIDLHPDIFAAFPRINTIHKNIKWQIMYRKIDWANCQTRAELPGSGRKPWPQKGTGRARHGSRRSPLWHAGSKVHGPRGPKTYYFMPDFYTRVHGLCNTLSAKFAQDDIKIVDSLDIPSEDPKFLEDLVEKRKWGLSVLFVDDSDLMPKNISIATSLIDHMNLMPVYGLNCYSMLKHETLVLTIAAVNKIEEKLNFHLHRHDAQSVLLKNNKFRLGYG